MPSHRGRRCERVRVRACVWGGDSIAMCSNIMPSKFENLPGYFHTHSDRTTTWCCARECNCASVGRVFAAHRTVPKAANGAVPIRAYIAAMTWAHIYAYPAQTVGAWTSCSIHFLVCGWQASPCLQWLLRKQVSHNVRSGLMPKGQSSVALLGTAWRNTVGTAVVVVVIVAVVAVVVGTHVPQIIGHARWMGKSVWFSKSWSVQVKEVNMTWQPGESSTPLHRVDCSHERCPGDALSESVACSHSSHSNALPTPTDSHAHNAHPPA